jgi:hypothetical protein
VFLDVQIVGTGGVPTWYVCVVMTDCKKLKISLFMFTSFAEIAELVKKLKWLVGGAHSMLSEKPIFSWWEGK